MTDTAKRCKHPNAYLDRLDSRSVTAICDECELTWSGLRKPWRSHRGKLHQPPQWVTDLIECEEMRTEQETNYSRGLGL